MELILDTKQDCFLCLKTIPETLQEEEEEPKVVCLKNICRFLQINTARVLLQGLKDLEKDPSELLQDMEYNFSVALCHQCEAVTKKLSSLISDLEVTQLHVNFYLQLFQRTLKGTNSSAVEATTNREDSMTANARLVAHLRKDAKQKCYDHNRKMSAVKSPVVRLKDVLVTTKDRNLDKSIIPTENIPGDPAPATRSSEDLPSPPRTRRSLLNEEVEKRSSDAFPLGNLNSEEMEKTLSDLLNEHCPKLDDLSYHRCTFCAGTVYKVAVRKHLLRTHPDKLLLFAKDPPVSEDIFAKICRYVIHGETSKCPRVFGRKTSGKYISPLQILPRLCYLCGGTLKTLQFLKDHLVMCHSDVLKGRLDDLQKDNTSWEFLDASENDPYTVEDTMVRPQQPKGRKASPKKPKKSPKKKMRRPPTPRKPPKSTSCIYCNQRFSQAVATRVHMLRKHPDQIFLSAKPPHRSLAQFSGSCRQVFERETDAYRDTYRKNETPKTFQCAYCTGTHGYRSGYLHHLVNFHRDVLAEKIRELENQKERHPDDSVGPASRRKKRPNKRTTQDVPKIRPRKGRKPEDGVQRRACPIVCPHCSSTVHRPDTLRTHVLRLHPEQIFLSSKPDRQPLPQFAKSCGKILAMELSMYDWRKEGGPVLVHSRKCAYCDILLHRDKMSYLNHLVCFHKEILTEKIKVLAGGPQEESGNLVVVEEEEEMEGGSYPVVEGEEWFSWPREDSEGNSQETITEDWKESWDILESVPEERGDYIEIGPSGPGISVAANVEADPWSKHDLPAILKRE